MEIEKDLIFFDLETTGVDIVDSRIVEIYATKIFKDKRKKPECKEYRINPTVPIPKEASDVHKILDEDVKDCPTFSRMSKGMHAWFQGCDMGGYNIKFDICILFSEFDRCGINNVWDYKIVDPFVIWRQQEPHTLTGAAKYFLEKDFGDEAHAAKADVDITIDVLEVQLDKYKLESIYSLSDHVDMDQRLLKTEEGIVFDFGKCKGELVSKQKSYATWMLSGSFHWHTKMMLEEIIKNK